MKEKNEENVFVFPSANKVESENKKEREKNKIYQHQTKCKLATKKVNSAVAEMVIRL